MAYKRKVTDAYKAQQRAYDEQNTAQVKLKLNINTDMDILNKLEAVPNKQGYIKELIRKDIERS